MFTFEEGKIENIPLDNETSKSNLEYQFYEKNNNKFFYLLSSSSKKIIVYDWITKAILNKINLIEEGPDGVGHPNDFFVKSPDSIYILSRYLYRLSLINSKGTVIDKYRLLPSETPFDEKQLSRPPSKYGYTALPTAGNAKSGDIIDDGKLITLLCDPNLNHMNYEEYYKHAKNILIYDKKTKNITYSLPFPDIYKNNLFYPTQYDWRYRTYNPRKNKAIVSFPADNNIYEMDINGSNIKAIMANSMYFDEVKPMSAPVNNPEDRFKHAVNNFYYGGIYYDKFKEIYYRLVNHPMNVEGDIRNTKLKSFETSIIVLSKNYKILGEIKIPKKYFSGVAFVNSEGIYLKKMTTSDDSLPFVLLKYKPRINKQ
ncbi:hypothetical protein BLX24_11010 [Arsenicibacter rosenii]|uniref:DUF4221 domain-containing protein n=1 Tax=Arsenicibacter rosenii TaxID=1750698 RepID=A0A1S2VNY0_9BACT|nr:hypothetical protein BLX24_11010 [Arsenicibacter rosenii]